MERNKVKVMDTWTQIKDENDWKSYTENMNRHSGGGYLNHYGEPSRYPCMAGFIRTENYNGADNIHHFFVYIKKCDNGELTFSVEDGDEF